MVLNDLSRYSDEEVQLGGLAGSVRLLFKHIHEPMDERAADSWLATVIVVAASSGGLKAAALIVEYVMRARSPDPALLVELVKPALGGQGAKMVMTTAERLHVEGARRLLVLQAEDRFGPLTASQRAVVTTASMNEVEAWALALWKVDSLESLLGASED